MTCPEFRDSRWGFVSVNPYVLQSHFQLTKSFSGATSHEVRDHFLQWAPHELESRLKPGIPTHKAFGQWASETARYRYCLFVDDICLESLDHETRNCPVVKVLEKDWGPLSLAERQYEIHPDFHDGETDDGEEEVGWMYLPVFDYLNWYDILTEEDAWWPFYVRPPYIDWAETKDDLVGSWRNK
ncbi:hypothetical protein JX265_009597 [Neoarthrinium moseri]|uniref:Uncharacterized protein n=1 Tax=Neoarthrinium moseri TaxID=1658444 RepID=A0A9Q0AL91_9PEZI|nr:uncharacterized protein JN550_012850 [Neoarthrinium moseri]KAI1858094.1 hypothetical protein JN550_012850 [Neoarthrinium moseri]KAI1861630.1 hypothetical protein JX265_009597 [Neoarthrinium moseri]